MGQSCSTCRFWRRNYSAGGPPSSSGDCRRNAPTVLGESLRGLWPVTALGEWCGEYQPAEAEPATETKRPEEIRYAHILVHGVRRESHIAFRDSKNQLLSSTNIDPDIHGCVHLQVPLPGGAPIRGSLRVRHPDYETFTMTDILLVANELIPLVPIYVARRKADETRT